MNEDFIKMKIYFEEYIYLYIFDFNSLVLMIYQDNKLIYFVLLVLC